MDPTVESLHKAPGALANEIAANSTLAVQGVKRVIAASRGRPLAEGMDYNALWNAAFLQSDDVAEAFQAFSDKRPAIFMGH